MADVTIPVVDISASNAEAASQLLSAASSHGFVYIENNDAGVKPSLIAEVFALSKSFFALPVDIKATAAIKSNQAATQKRPDVKEALNVSVPLPSDQALPEPLQPYRDTITAFQQACQQLCLQIMSRFAEALAIDTQWFTSRHDQTKGKSGTILRILYYPALSTAIDASIEDIRAGAHSDYGSITLLFQLPGQPGLEIRTGDDTWSSVQVDPSDNLRYGKPLPILVNIGDLLEDWTAGLLKSTVHRVMFPTEAKDAGDRYSIAYFCHPLDEVLLEPVPSKLVRQHGTDDNHKIITARQHLMNRLAATYTIS